MSDTLHIASGPNTQTFAPYQLLAGDTPPVATVDMTVTTGLSFVQGEVVAQLAGKIVKYNPAAETSAAQAIGVMNYAVNTSGGERKAAIYVGGCFNVAALTYPAGVTTIEAKQAAFAGTGISVRKLAWSGDTAHGSI